MLLLTNRTILPVQGSRKLNRVGIVKKLFMKKVLTITGIILTSFTVNAQMTIENNYSNVNADAFLNDGDMAMEVVNLSTSGRKYLVRDMAGSKLRIYNLNHTIWKTINLPAVANHVPGYTSYLSEGLFNTDSKLEVAVYYRNTTPNVYVHKIVIVNEDGNILNTVDSAEVIKVFNAGNNSYKAIIEKDGDRAAVFSLPGTIPCDVCGNGLGLGKPGKETNSGNISAPIPNPSSNQTKIEYTLPEGVSKGDIELYNMNGQKVRSYNVDKSYSSVTIDNSELPAGTYFYYLKAVGTRSEARKMTIVKIHSTTFWKHHMV